MNGIDFNHTKKENQIKRIQNKIKKFPPKKMTSLGNKIYKLNFSFTQKSKPK